MSMIIIVVACESKYWSVAVRYGIRFLTLGQAQGVCAAY